MAFRKRTNAYWERRAEEQLTLVEQLSLKHLNEIDRAYLTARKLNLEAIKTLYLAYYAKQGWDTEALRAIAPRGDIRRFMEAVSAAGLSNDLPDGYGFRLTRLQLVEASLWLEATKAVKAHEAIETAAHRETIETAYDYSMYNLSKGTGVAPAFTQLNTKAVDNILATKFYGKNYSDRIWKNGTKLATGLKQELAAAVASGQSQTKTTKMLKDRYAVTRFEAARLVRTETNHFNTLATTESYHSAGLEQFIYVATLDGRTSTICQELDGKRFDLDDSSHKPPQHPNCRSTLRAYIGEEYEPDTRIMRDPNTGKNRYIGNISFEQWRELYL